MTKLEVRDVINQIIREAVRRSGGLMKPSYNRDIDMIFSVMGKLSPEVKEKPAVPQYDPKKVRRVGTLVQRHQFTNEQREAAVEALRAVGLL